MHDSSYVYLTTSSIPSTTVTYGDDGNWSFNMPAGNVTVSAMMKTQQGLSWKDEHDHTVAEAYAYSYPGAINIFPTLSYLAYPIEYSSSNTSYASINSSGVITIPENANGTTTITAQYTTEKDSEYLTESVQYTLQVSNA